jgi:hypothetical protein
MKRPLRYVFVGLVIIASVWGYSERSTFLHRFSRIDGAKRLGSSAYAKNYRSAVECAVCDTSKERRKIRWDLWCIGMAANIDSPSKMGDRLFLRVRAGDRTDAEFIYVFDASGEVVEVARIPLA